MFVVGVSTEQLVAAILLRNDMNGAADVQHEWDCGIGCGPCHDLGGVLEASDPSFAVAHTARSSRYLIGGPYGWWANHRMHVQGDSSDARPRRVGGGPDAADQLGG